MTKKTIVIISYYYHPQITPRAFRAKELASEFIKQCWDVILITPSGLYKNGEILAVHGSEPSLPKQKTQKQRRTPIKSFINKILRRLLPGGKDLAGALNILRHATKTKINADLVISIGLPFSVHLATYVLKSARFIRAPRFIADYGDPFSAMEARYKGCLYAKFIERVVLRKFDEITIPVDSAKLEFKSVTDLNKIHISPQGLDITQFETSEYKEICDKPRFAYAGQFYTDIRNPAVLFEYLNTLSTDFEFHLYTNTNQEATRQILDKYQTPENIFTHELLPRNKCIFELSKYDFLINIENEINTQVPSKLIDYSLTGRPVFSFKPSTFDHKIFDEFLSKNYEKALLLDHSKFNIVTVVENLIHQNNHS